MLDYSTRENPTNVRKRKKITYTQQLLHPQAKLESGRRLAASIRKLDATTDDSGEDDEMIVVTEKMILLMNSQYLIFRENHKIVSTKNGKINNSKDIKLNITVPVLTLRN